MVTPDETSVLDEVVPDVVVVLLVAAPVSADADVEPLSVVELDVLLPVVDGAVDPVDDGSEEVSLDVALVESDEDVPVVSAAATP
jgi:hypothetical protein